jgi:hypothetical protein
MKVLGLDISRNFAVGFILESKPDLSPLVFFQNSPKKTVRRKQKEYLYHSAAILLTNDSKGIKTFKALSPEVMILEPTGYWYSHFWVTIAEQLGCQIYWMSHQALASHRKHYGFKNKNDDIDAFILALTWFDDLLPERKYIQNYAYPLINELRLNVYERKRLLKALNRTTNQLSQYFEVEFPEIATRDLTTLNKKGINPVLGHLMGIYNNRKWPKENTGIGISKRSLRMVNECLNYQEYIKETESEMLAIMKHREFIPYMKVFKDYGFSIGLASHLLIRVYPLNRFLSDAHVIKDANRHNLSLRKFQAYLGLGYFYQLSGDSSHSQGKIKKSWQGSDLIRSDLFIWLIANPCNGKFRPQTQIQYRLRELWLSERSKKLNLRENNQIIVKQVNLPSFQSLGKDGVLRFAFVLTRWLFRDLLREINSLDF